MERLRGSIDIVEIGLTLLVQANLPLKLQWNAFVIAIYLINIDFLQMFSTIKHPLSCYFIRLFSF